MLLYLWGRPTSSPSMPPSPRGETACACLLPGLCVGFVWAGERRTEPEKQELVVAKEVKFALQREEQQELKESGWLWGWKVRMRVKEGFEINSPLWQEYWGQNWREYFEGVLQWIKYISPPLWCPLRKITARIWIKLRLFSLFFPFGAEGQRGFPMSLLYSWPLTITGSCREGS